MTVEATHDARSYVTLQIAIRAHGRLYATDAWSATIVLTLAAGEQMTALVCDVRVLLTSPRAATS
ncbi:hypothetical protein I4J89_37005 [Actinoplanes sp. NEAU-A11]|uniref:Uncharacterized protein n=2 Tax=Actinoplanes aureus TaxID=2792083 RepID=A0A931G3J1_9ACTN|nr:hypothetical protein [Actinoplanes aureus]